MGLEYVSFSDFGLDRAADNGAWISVTTPDGSGAGIRALVTERSYQGNGRGAALLRAVLAKYPGQEGKNERDLARRTGGGFSRSGFSRLSMTRWQMIREFA